MANEARIDQIEAWLQGKMPAAEAAAFQAELDADPALAEQVALHRLTLQAMEHLSEQDLQQQTLQWLGNIDLDTPPEKPRETPTSPYRTWFWITLALLLLTGAFVLYQWITGSEQQNIKNLEREIQRRDSLLFEERQRPTLKPEVIDSLARQNEQLRQQLQEATEGSGERAKSKGPMAYYKKPDLDAFRRGDNTPAEELLKEGIKFFKNADLIRAESKARDALKSEPDNRDAMRLLAHALFGQQRFMEAGAEFARMQKEYANNTDGAREAEWHQLLCYRALSADAGQRKLYRAALEKILLEPNNPYQGLALEMKAADRQ